jgi:hypothetical protein
VTTLATPANMRAVEAANPARKIGACTIMGRRTVAYSPTTGEQYSASAGDYMLPDDEPLCDSEGEPMILVFERTVRVDALTEEVV